MSTCPTRGASGGLAGAYKFKNNLIPRRENKPKKQAGIKSKCATPPIGHVRRNAGHIAGIRKNDGGLYWACAWVISECLTPPSNPIKVGTIYSYLNILEKFFNGSIALSDLDPEDWIIMREAMLQGRSPDAASDVEGALLHLGCFMRSLGFDVPTFFLRNQAKLTQVPLRQPVVVFPHEAEKAASLLSQLEAPWTASAIEKLRLMAHVGVRPIEATNLAARDVGIHGQLIHITTAGFDHLKTTHSRGSVTITDPQLQRLLEETGELRSAAALPSEMPLLFREEGVDATPEINAAILWALRQATGKARLTLRDLRASAITRSIAPIEELLGALTTSLPVHGDCNSTEDIRRKSISMALAIRRARHSISFPTTQRHYDAGGAIRLAVTLRQHEAKLELGSDFIAAVTGKTKAAVEVARHRAGISISDVEKSWKDFIGILRPHFSKFSEPALAESIPVGSAIPRAPAFESAGWSLMLWQYGLDDELIAHVTGVTEDSLKRQVLEIERALGYPLARDRAAVRSRELPTILSSIPARKFWRELISHRSDFVKGGRFLFGRQTLHGALDMPSQVAACEAAALLTRCVPREWKVAIVAPPSYELERRAALRQSLTALDIHLETRKSSRVNGWTVRVDPADGSRFAPRAVGEITKYVLRGALVASFF